MKLTNSLLPGLVLVLLSGPALPATDDAQVKPQLSLDDMRTFTDVFSLVQVNYVDAVGDKDLLDSAMRGMVASLDPHSQYLSPEEARRSDESARGIMAGIGVEIDVRDGRIFIASVITDGPADRAGVTADEMLTAVNGQAVKGHPLRQSLRALRGKPGTVVEVSFAASGQKPRTLSLTREYIPVSSVIFRLLDDNTAYVNISHFHVGSADDFREALESARQSAGGELAGVVIDLRGNGGGVVASAISIADGFLDQGLVVFTQGREKNSRREYHSEDGQWLPGVPVAVLVNHRTASASEILAGALQDHDRAVLVGEKTFGKGTVQSVLQLRNGSALKLTTARYFTPSGRSINKTGLEPDVAAKFPVGMEMEDDQALAVALEVLKEGKG